ncbi:hypothetical protein [Promicromonospora iranensis]|uniref:Uncharacterized protein n=1 Tax=Promicromonospora iranensis TaxID=1105144 RepID=A0ABU2CUV0_9MICO|nr:hypothetical protein [Promicromonospora iranensis]MDR7385105.1 hypothetical protein [Promicromonospora iranensis]
MEQRLAAGGLVLELAAEDTDRLEVTMGFRPQAYGPLRGELTVAGRLGRVFPAYGGSRAQLT